MKTKTVRPCLRVYCVAASGRRPGPPVWRIVPKKLSLPPPHSLVHKLFLLAVFFFPKKKYITPDPLFVLFSWNLRLVSWPYPVKQ